MKKVIFLTLLLFVLLAGGWADSHYKYIYSWDMDVYFGHIVYPEAKRDGKDALVWRGEQDSPEVADLNLPIAPGDTIRTTERRCEIQFDTGTIVRLDRNTELKIETILAPSLSSNKQVTNLILNRGRVYVMYKRYVRREICQFITPLAAVKVNHESVTVINTQTDGTTDIHVERGKAYVLFGKEPDNIHKEKIKESQSCTVTLDHHLVMGQFVRNEDFEAWNQKINADFLELHEGQAVIPMPIQKLNKAVFYFAQKYSHLHGEWVWDRFFGYVWRPFLNDMRYPWGGWQPYFYGRWTSVNGQLFWVPQESWGWVPYHLGIWKWSEKKGWLWIPGSLFAPAWVDWAFYQGYYTWWPYSPYQYLYKGYYSLGFYAMGDYGPGTFLGQSPLPASNPAKRSVLKTVRKDQLKKTQTPPFPLTKKVKKACKKIKDSLRNNHEEILFSLKEMPRHMIVVKEEDLSVPQIQQKVMRLVDMPKEEQKKFFSGNQRIDPYQRAVRAFVWKDIASSLHRKLNPVILSGDKEGEDTSFAKPKPVKYLRDNDQIYVRMDSLQPPRLKTEAFSRVNVLLDKHPIKKKEISPVRSGRRIEFGKERSFLRIRDWNPDVRIARRAGVSIEYSSLSNEVRCPELKISSKSINRAGRHFGRRVRLTSSGVSVSSGSGGSRYHDTSSGSSSRSSGTRSSGGETHGSRSSKGKVKK